MSGGSGKSTGIPRATRFINTGIAVVLIGISAYHYTQPNGAWRSGTTELFCAIVLLAAAYLFSRLVAFWVNLIVAIGISGLGFRHLLIGRGWVSGSIEEIFAVLLVVAAIIIYRDRKAKRA